MARLDGIQCTIERRNFNKEFLRLENKLQGELKTILRQEELMWFQRSRVMWLADGDQNTKYYHLKTVNRRRKNKIITIKDDSG